MRASRAEPLARERRLILALLISLAAACWVVLVWQPGILPGTPASAGMPGMDQSANMAGANMPSPAPGLSLTMGMGALLFLAMWVVMMVAMMFPTAAPMILTFSRVYAGKRQQGQAFVPTWVFVGAYLIVWVLFGVLAYGAAAGLEALSRQWPGLAANGGRIGGILLVLAGLYQLSPLKTVCLSKCRSPLAFVLTSWRDGYGGAVRMGVAHGLYCLGCCWMLFVILFPLGIMNVLAMAAITLLIFGEKSLPWSRRIAQGAAVALVAYGVLAIFVPAVLPALTPAPDMMG